jgi:hypothetical protein
VIAWFTTGKTRNACFIVSWHYFSFVIKPGIDATWFNVLVLYCIKIRVRDILMTTPQKKAPIPALQMWENIGDVHENYTI